MTDLATISVIDTAERALRRDECEALTTLIAASYEQTTGVIQAEWTRSTRLYLATAPNGRIESIFFIAWETLPLDGGTAPIVYLGLSATQQDAKNSGSVRRLYRRFVEDAQNWELEHDQRLLLWFTSATPSSCLAADLIFAKAEPRSNGSYSEAYLPVLTAIRASLGAPAAPDDHPFVVKRCSPHRLYSTAERRRIAAICEKFDFTLLRDLGVDETQGDRLIYLCRVPDRCAP